ncbi:stalk domain-containing protein [Paenibacillus sp. EC2-1]|uniref:stalk domain-containing protein n=1 Tax=Paenibacillus sp. EC2-1 TaxID=3388665 RepID=UPI003BEEFA1D
MTIHSTTTPLKKKFIAAGLSGVILLAGSCAFMTEVHAQTTAEPQAIALSNPSAILTYKTLKSDEPALVTNIQIPVFQGLKDAKYQAQLNDIIESHASKDLANWKKEAKEMAQTAKQNGQTMRPYELNISYELTADGTGTIPNLISLKVNTEITTGNSPALRVDTYNFLDEQQATLVTLQNLFGNDYKQMIDSKIKSAIAADAENYFEGEDGFQGIGNDQSFYVTTDGKVVVVFEEYSIAPGSTGTPEFTFDLPSTNTNGESTVIKAKSTLTTDDGKVMIPLADVVRALQFDVKWNNKSKTVEVRKDAIWTSVTVGKDSYFFGKMAPHKLGAAPVLHENHVYVPLNFLTDILHAETVKGVNGDITVNLK